MTDFLIPGTGMGGANPMIQKMLDRGAASDERSKQAEAELKASQEREAKARAAQAAVMQPKREELRTALGQTTPIPETKPTPEAPKAPIIDQKEIGETLSLITALAALGGALTRQPLTAALNNFSAGVKGYVQGNQEVFANSMKEFEANLKKAKADHDATWEKYKAARDKHANDIQAMQQELSIIAAETQSPIDMELAKQGRIVDLMKIHDTRDSKFTSVMANVARMMETAETHRQAHADRMAALQVRKDAQSDKGWKLMKDKAGQVYRVNVNAGIQQKQTKAGWEDIEQLPPDVMNVGAKENQGRMFEEKAGMQYNTMKLATKEIDDLERRGLKDMPFLGDISFDNHGIANAVGRLGLKKALTDEQQQLVSAAQLFAEAAGHLERGANLTDQQFQRVVKEFIPQPGDKPGTLKLKKDHRDNLLEGGRIVSGEVGAKIDERDKARAASPTKPKVPARTNEKGWTLHTDKDGNQAYVSPDGAQFEEVR